jgi:MoaA/NifB/PqqE/SkfB family radical SAM enzyme
MKEERVKTLGRAGLPCHYPWSAMYVSPDGDVRHCCSTNAVTRRFSHGPPNAGVRPIALAPRTSLIDL